MTRPIEFMKSRQAAKFTRLSYPDAPHPHGVQLIFKKYNYEKMVSNPSTVGGLSTNKYIKAQANRKAATEQETIIELPMPLQLNDQTDIGVAASERTFTETFLAQTLSKAGSDFGGTASRIAQALQSTGGSLATMFETGDDGGLTTDAQAARDSFAQAASVNASQLGRILTEVGRTTIEALGISTKSIGAMSGSVANPQSTLFFSGVNLRKFAFDFELRPNNSEEAETIRKVVNALKRNTLPKIQSLNASDLGTDGASLISDLGGGAVARAFLEYPAVCFINLLGVDERHFPRFKPTMVNNVTADYGDGGMAIAQGGVPASIKLSLSFEEIQIQTAEDYEKDDEEQGGQEDEQ